MKRASGVPILFLVFFLVWSVQGSAEIELDKEYIPTDEASSIKEILQLVEFGFTKANEKAKVAVRDAHAHHQGCVKAKFQVLPNLPADQQVGVFAYEKGAPKEYKAWVRYSSGNGSVLPDYVWDARGMGIKLVAVKGTRAVLASGDEKATQDFLMINHPQFFIRNAVDYIAFMKNRDTFFADPKRAKHEALIAQAIGGQFVTSPLETNFFSMTPVLLGNRAIKFSVQPCDPKKEKSKSFGRLDLEKLFKIIQPLRTPKDFADHAAELEPYKSYLREAMQFQLDENVDRCFDFMIQFQEDADKMPIEDPTIQWDSKFYKVAKLTISKQAFTSDKQDLFCEDMTITPWHALEVHRPLGGIQRVRKGVYELVTGLRHRQNKHKMIEPTGDEVFP